MLIICAIRLIIFLHILRYFKIAELTIIEKIYVFLNISISEVSTHFVITIYFNLNIWLS